MADLRDPPLTLKVLFRQRVTVIVILSSSKKSWLHQIPWNAHVLLFTTWQSGDSGFRQPSLHVEQEEVNCKGFASPRCVRCNHTQGFMKWSEIFVLIAHWLRIHSDAQSWQTWRAATLPDKLGSGVPSFRMQQLCFIMQSDPRLGLYDWLLHLRHLILQEAPAVVSVVARWFVMSSSSSFSTEFRNAVSRRLYKNWTYCLNSKYVLLKIIHGGIWGKVTDKIAPIG